MQTQQINITLGTAGHIDHGKTSLVKLLTGCDTDRLKIEKERGMTIELGFAPCTISTKQVGIVDVPGHEHFIKTMVAGATGIDAVIFVIAADDGIMPQTREHLDILTLLGVKYGIVALTKADCVNQERIQTVTENIKTFLVGTFLDGVPICPLSCITGEGFGAFYDSLVRVVDKIEPKKVDGIFRLPVERAFSLKGYGTVISGIPVCGSVRVGDEVVLLPQQTKGKIRAIQVYGRDSDTALCGQCAALNIPHFDHKTIRRGDCLTIGDYFQPQMWYLCKFAMLNSAKYPLKNGMQIKFHTGTSEIVGTLYTMEGNIVSAGQQSIVQVKLNEPVVAAPNDRFIVRTLSPVQTVGGGIILEAVAKKLKRTDAQVLDDVKNRSQMVSTAKDFVEYCLKTADGFAAGENAIALRTKLAAEQVSFSLDELSAAGLILKLTSGLYIHKDNYALLKQKLLDIVSGFHSDHPESPGIPFRDLLEHSGLKKGCFDGVVASLVSAGKLVERKDRLALPEHRERFSADETKQIETVESLFINRLFNPPLFDELFQLTGIESKRLEKIFKILIEQQRLIRVEDDLFFHQQALEKAKQILISYIRKEGKLESVKFKYLLDTSRKFAIPLLDYFDRTGLTRRDGYTRFLKTAQ
jgi:selenocysteine-specific elongation factor